MQSLSTSLSSSLPSSKILSCLSLFLLFMIIAPPTAAVKLPSNVIVPAMIAFGDSLVDPGNNNYIKTTQKCNFPPYGKDFRGGIPTGRWSNGRILTDFLVEEFSIKQYLPAYLEPNLGPEDLLSGVSFASGATGFDPLTSKLTSVIPISQQLEYFKDYIKKLNYLVGDEKTQFILNNSIFIILAGTNDLSINYFDAPFRRTQYDVDSYTDLLVNLASDFIQDLYNLGARRISVLTVWPVGCEPIQRTIEGGVLRECVEANNRATELFNSKLCAKVASLAYKLPNSTVACIDTYSPSLEMINYPNKYGFEEVKRGCCGTGLIEEAISCNKLDPVCVDVSKFIYWDSVHFTERGFQTLVSLIIEKFVNVFFHNP